MKHQALVCLSLSVFFAGAVNAADTFSATYTTKNYGVKHAKGFVRSEKGLLFQLTAPSKSFTGTTTPIPGSYSFRGKAGPVEDQGQCGSCWDFSLTSVLRGTWMMAGKDPGRLSFNYLLNCATEQQGCDGGDFNAAAHFVKPQGAPKYGSDGDYSEQAGACQKEPPVASTVDYKMLGAGGTNPSFQDIAYVVGVLHRPVSIDIAATDDWENYSYGTYNNCTDQKVADINHMVSIEGYSCDKSVDSHGNCVFDATGNLPKGQGTWIIRNSWGDGWGDMGYITMAATDAFTGEKCDEVAADALYYDVE